MVTSGRGSGLNVRRDLRCSIACSSAMLPEVEGVGNVIRLV
jgi:hypothetical protein